MSTTDPDIIAGLIENPERNFTRLLFVLRLWPNWCCIPMADMRQPSAACACGRTSKGITPPFSSILEEMENAECADSFGSCLELVNRLLHYAPDGVIKLRMLRELDEIRFESHLRDLCCRFPSAHLDENIEKTGKRNSTAHSVNSDAADEVNRLINEIDSPDALALLADLLREVRNAKEPSSKLLQRLNAHVGTLLHELPVENGKPPTSAPPPPPPPPLLPSVKSAPAPPPPPPPTDEEDGRTAAASPERPPAASSANGRVLLSGPKAKAEVPAALKPKVLPSDGKKLRHLQWTKIPLNSSPRPTPRTASNIWLQMDSLGLEFVRTKEGGLDRLRMLVPLLPTEEECQTLRNYTGNRAELGTAEQFLLLLLEVPNYALRIESIILREEFSALVKTIEPDLEDDDHGLQSKAKNLRTVLLILLHMGNYLNHGGGLGNAVAFKLSSLWKIDELRAIKGGRTLLHLVAQQAEQTGANLDDIAHVDDAAKVPFESLKNDVKTSTERVKRLDNQLKEKGGDLFFTEMRTFLAEAEQQMAESNRLLADLDEERRQLAVYFCENEKTFSLEECFKIFSNFRSRFIIAAMVSRSSSVRTVSEKSEKKRSQERNLVTIVPSASPTPLQPPTSPRSPAASVASLSPTTIRRASVIVEQDRDRNSVPQLPTLRRKSSVRRESGIFDKLPTADGALEINRRRSSSRIPPNSSLPSVSEFRDNENRETEEVRVAVPTLESRLVDSPPSVRVSSEPIKEPARRPLTAEENKQPAAERKISEPAAPAFPSPPTARPPSAITRSRLSSASNGSTHSLRTPASTQRPPIAPLARPQTAASSTTSTLRKTTTKPLGPGIQGGFSNSANHRSQLDGRHSLVFGSRSDERSGETTASRPALIKTGSTTERPRWF
ncbi:FH2 domain-containing protein 1 [Aphelenchoides fujianensis]|nr:FH2 domain-containing protein 1 [Aphelenchoides fujianensis]